MIERFFPKLKDLNGIKRKIKQGKPVSIGVFCSGNGVRSPMGQLVLQEEFRKHGFDNVNVFSFGVSVYPSTHLKPIEPRTLAYAKELGYSSADSIKRRSLGDNDVQKQIENADLLLAVSPAHMAMAAEYYADQHPEASTRILRKTWTIRGLANRTQWTLPFDGLARMRNRLYRGLTTSDPYFMVKTKGDEKEFRKQLDVVAEETKKAAKRIIPK